MHSIRKNKFIAAMASPKIAVYCLLLLCILTVCGTLYQVSYGIHEAKARYFTSWYFLVWDIVPLPGGQSVMWCFSINLLSSLIYRIELKWKKAGFALTHLGLLLFCFAALWTYLFSVESYLTLEEGASSNVSTSRYHWELAVWKIENGKKYVESQTLNSNIGKDDKFSFHNNEVQFTVLELYHNCSPSYSKEGRDLKNASGYSKIIQKKLQPDQTLNRPGGIFILEQNQDKILLIGEENNDLKLNSKKSSYFTHLRRKRNPLPVTLRLDDVNMKNYSGTQIASHYESRVYINGDGMPRQTRISMNNPLRISDFTFYQSGYRNSGNSEFSTLSVVKNSGRLLPYIASFIMGLGLLVESFYRMFKIKKRNK
jgi:cytochrome c biogenesis protein ResB